LRATVLFFKYILYIYIYIYMSYKYTSAPVEVSFRAGAAAKVGVLDGPWMDGMFRPAKGAKGRRNLGPWVNVNMMS
jgi:hypothetical protein